MNDEQIRMYLRGKGIPQFIDKFIMAFVSEQPDDWKPLLTKLIKADSRSGGKGQVAHKKEDNAPTQMKSMKYMDDEGGDGPAYTQRDPRVRPSMEQIKKKGVVTSTDTRSEIKAPHLNKDYCSTVAAQFNLAAIACQQACKKILKQCEAEQKPFFDDTFWYGSRRAMYPKGAPEDCTVTEPKKVMRATELYPGATLFSGGVGANDIIQGAVGDCFFIGAVSALASLKTDKLKPLERLFTFHNIQWGIFGVCFFKNGEWEWVIVDDWIAVNQDGRDVWPQYASPGTEAELWPLIIEKAYAKLHFCWDSIDGGWSRQALEDMTGGLAYTLNLEKQDKETFGSANNDAFQELATDGLTVLGCSVGWHVEDAAGAGRAGEQGAVHGLFKGHAYSIIKFAETRDGTGFVRVRNPWGNDAEWKGPYADGAPEWDQNPHHKRDLNPVFKDDGAFWMKWDDFRAVFTDIDVARFFPYDWVVMSMVGKAPEKDICPQNTYMIKVEKPVKGLVFSLGQHDPLVSQDHHERKNGRLSGVKLSLFKLTREPRDFADLQNCLGDKMVTKPSRDRTIFYEVERALEPGIYSLVPKFQSSNVSFYVRVFTPPGSCVEMWRYSDSKARMHSDHGEEFARDVPSVGVPKGNTEDLHAAVEEAPEAVDMVQVRGGPPTPQGVLDRLGCRSQAEYNALLTAAFNKFDPYNLGKLDRNKVDDAMEYVVAECPKVESVFAKEWAEEAGGKENFMIRLNGFCHLITDVLQQMYDENHKRR